MKATKEMKQGRHSLDSYISYETILDYQGIIDRFIYVDTIATLGSTRKEQKKGRSIEFYNIPEEHNFGYDKEGMAEPEKALLDLIYRESQRERLNYMHEVFEEVDWEELSLERLDEYSRRMGFDWRKYLPDSADSRHPELAELISSRKR